MPHVLQLKDGKLFTPFDFNDALNAVEDYCGYELRKFIEECIAEKFEDIEDWKFEYEDLKRDFETQGDYQRSVLCDIREEADALGELLVADRLNRDKLNERARNIYTLANNEL